MCEKNDKIEIFSENDLIFELYRRDMFTKSKTNEKIIKDLVDNTNVKLILTYGYPSGMKKCRECGELLTSENFKYYLGRVDKNGYLMRSNALCNSCSKISNKQRQDVFEKDKKKIPDKPKNNDICPSCDREWDGNWHKHHIDNDFICWICGDCNMSFRDQRNKNQNRNQFLNA